MFSGERIAILDTEYTAWEGCIETGWDADAGQYREVVQIASLLVETESLEIVDSFDRLVRPQINPELSAYFVSLTGIQQEDIAEKPTFEVVASSFLEWVGDHRVYSWGREGGTLDRNVKLYDASIQFHEDQFQDIRPLLKTCGVPVDEHTSSTVSEFFDAGLDERQKHDALSDCRSILAALRAVATTG